MNFIFFHSTLFQQTAALTALMIFFSALPEVVPQARRHSAIILLIGTGGILSLVAFDLLPDLFKLGGVKSLGLMALVWAMFAFAQKFHSSHHYHDPDQQIRQEHAGNHPHGHSHHSLHSPWLFVFSMSLHCISSGMLLALSQTVAKRLGPVVFLVLAAHKGYEALNVSIVIHKTFPHRKSARFAIGVYSLSLATGVALTALLSSWVELNTAPTTLQTIAVIVMAFASGSLMSCLYTDFLQPSLHRVRERRARAAWMLLGALLTWIFTIGIGA